MSLYNTLKRIKISFIDMKRFVNTKCLGSESHQDLLCVLQDQMRDVNELESCVASGKYKTALKIIESHVYPRQEGFYLKRNYDYDEGWHKLLDDFRAGKIKSVTDAVKKLRKWPGQKDSTDDPEPKKIDDSKRKKKVNRASDDSAIPTESYCGSERNRKYWKQLKKDKEEDNAVEDFLRYIEEISC